VNDVPHNDEPSDDIDDLYRRAAALDPSRPSAPVRAAVLAHAAQLAAHLVAERPSDKTQDTSAPAPIAPSSSEARRRPWYKAPRFSPRRLSTIMGTLAAAILVGLLVTPRFLLTRDTTFSSEAPVHIVSIAPPTAAPRAALPKAEGLQPYISRPQERASTHADERNFVAALPAALASAPTPPAPDSPVAGATLRRAAERGDIPKLQVLFDLGVDVNARDADDRSALLLAVLNGRTKVVELLLAHGANVNAADRTGTTPLRAAQSMHQTDIAATLRSAGAH